MNSVPIVSRMVYHFLGMSFLYVNYVVLTSYIRRYILEDIVRVGVMSKEKFFETYLKVKDKDRGKGKERNNDASETMIREEKINRKGNQLRPLSLTLHEENK